MFLAKYKMMLSSDCRMIYKTKDYHRKRIKVLEKERYIRRVNGLYIKLDDKGTRLVKQFGYDYSFKCRKKEYIERLKEIARIAALTLNSKIEFIASWNLKDNRIFTQTSRKYLGKLSFQGKESIVYYISKDKQISYISQVVNDIQKIIDYRNVIIFLEDTNKLTDKQRFIFGKNSTSIINPTSENLSIIRKFEKVDFYKIIKNIYRNKEILLSNWEKADYMTEEKEYILIMPFIDTEKLHRLKVFFRYNQNINIKLDIITLKENEQKIKEILNNKVNTIELDNWIGGKIEEREEN